MELEFEKIREIDNCLYYIGLAADNIECIAAAFHEDCDKSLPEANALLFAAHYLREETEKVKRMIFNN